MNPSLNQILSIITSVATLSLPNIENYVSARGGEFGFRSIVKNIPVFLPAILFKVMSVSILCVFLRGWTILIIVSLIVLMIVGQVITKSCYNSDFRDDDRQQGFECGFYSWLTLASLGRSKYAANYRFMSTLLITIIYSLILLMIFYVSSVDPESGYIHGAGFNWSDLELVKQPRYLNILNFTIGLGWTTLVLDFISAWCKSHDWRSHNWGPLKSIVDWFVDP